MVPLSAVSPPWMVRPPLGDVQYGYQSFWGVCQVQQGQESSRTSHWSAGFPTPQQLLPLSSSCLPFSLAPTLNAQFPNLPFPMYPSGHRGFPSTSLEELSSLASLQSNGFCSPSCGLNRCTSHGADKGPEDSTSLGTMTSSTIGKL